MIEGTIGDQLSGLEGLAFDDFEIGHGRDGYGDRQAAGFLALSLSKGGGRFDRGSWRRRWGLGLGD
jgi:hypothetical protein